MYGKKPDVGQVFPVTAPQTDDSFDAKLLGLQWQWNHNPVDAAWSLTARPGYLTLNALKAENFALARNTLTQKIMGATGSAVTELDLGGLAEGQKAGLCVMSKAYNLVGVRKKEGKTYLFWDQSGEGYKELSITGNKIYLKVQVSIKDNKNQFFYSTDNKTFTPFGSSFVARWGYWKGARIGLFSYNEKSDGGVAAFNWFSYDYDGPKE